MGLSIFILFWMSISLKKNYEKLGSIESESADNPVSHLLALQKQISSQKEHLENLEKNGLWPKNLDVLSWLTKQADDSNVKIIGVDYPPAEENLKYHNINISLNVRGDYNPLAIFINKLERSQNPILISSLRIKRKESAFSAKYSANALAEPEYVTMEISLSCFKKLEGT